MIEVKGERGGFKSRAGGSVDPFTEIGPTIPEQPLPTIPEQPQTTLPEQPQTTLPEQPQTTLPEQPQTNAVVSKEPLIKKEAVPVKNSAELHEYQLASRHLTYPKEFKQIGSIKIVTTEDVAFNLDPNGKFLEKLKKIKPEDGKVVKFLKLMNVAGTDLSLLWLIAAGVGTGLSHGTMDIIYRIGVGEKVKEVLDNLDIAVGSLQRRLIVADLIAKNIRSLNTNHIFSIAGGSCLLPIEGICQSEQEGVSITNVDRSPKANEKAVKTLAEINAKKNRGISVDFIQRDILENGLDVNSNDSENQIFECTGFWEYLNQDDREKLLKAVSDSMGKGDAFILTALVNNPQQDIFNAIGFKSLFSHNLEELIPFVRKYFPNIKEAVITPNGTYVTLVLSK